MTNFTDRNFLRAPLFLAILSFLLLAAPFSLTAKTVEPGWTQEGKASFYYGPLFHGKLTANQEIYDQDSLTAAHKTLPINTLVEVTRKANGRKVIVRINNRGPYVKGRIIDLSKEAARRLDMIRAGVTDVVIRVLPPNAVVDLSTKFSAEAAEVVTRWFSFAISLKTYATREEAQALLDELRQTGRRKCSLDSELTDDGNRIYKIVIGGFSNREEASQYLTTLEDASLIFNWKGR